MLAALLALFVSAEPAHAQQNDGTAADDEIGDERMVGLGLGHGTFTSGLTGKLYLAERSALQAFAGVFGSYGRGCGVSCGLSVDADFVYEFADLVDSEDGRLFLGAGGGAYVWTFYEFTEAGFGLDGVVELGWHFKAGPVELVVDVRPVLAFGDFTPGRLDVDAGFAARYFF